MSTAKLVRDIVQSINPRARRAARQARELREADAIGKLRAIERAMAVIEFKLDGTVLSANENFLRTLGYALDEIVGRHHSMFVDPVDRNSAQYQAFWAKLARGDYDSGQYRRIGKGGKQVWIEASYNPILDAAGKPVKVVKYATDISAAKTRTADFEGQLTAIDKAMAVIEFGLDGTILSANENFLRTLRYALSEVRGRHHSMFVEPGYRASEDYRAFWAKLARGEYDAGQYKRIAKDGKEVWIEASYNPILDANGRPFKVVKYATDITAAKQRAADFEGQLSAIGKAMAVIEFALDGTILDANENFLRTLGYAIGQVRGRHHSMFVDAAHRDSAEYRAFWIKLGRGEYDAGQYKRVGNGGKEVWIEASYNPILDMNGRPFKVVKYATDITAQIHAKQALELAVEQTLQVADAAKQGQLQQRIPMAGKSGALETLCGGVNALLDAMTDLVVQVRGAADAIDSAAREIAQGNADLSQRTSEQAASLEETAASMEELTSTVKNNADNAREANRLSAGASQIAQQGGQIVGEVVRTMSAINDSSKKVSAIITVIDSIAFQTNILALNAAVEAARAGDQGRGFAVVASEVRKLAHRSAEAAKEIEQLIRDSVAQVNGGAQLAERAGTTMDEIVQSVQQVTNIIGEISAASAEQTSGIEQVNQAVMQLDQTTQQNAALVEEAAAAAESLQEQAGKLVEAVAVYTVGGEAPPVERRGADRATNVARIQPSVRGRRGAAQPIVAPRRVG